MTRDHARGRFGARGPVLTCLALWGVVGFGLVLDPSPARADTLEEIFQTGNEAYFAGRFDAATRAYERLVELGVRDADVFYNLGTSYARRRQDGRAIAAFERAVRLSPGDGDARAALDRCRTRLAGQRAEREGEVTIDGGPPLGEALFGGLSENALAALALVFAGLMFGGLSVLPRVRAETWRLAVGIGVPLAAIGLAMSGLGVAIRAGWFEAGSPAVVVSPSARLLEGPRADAQERGEAREGERVWVLGREGAFARVGLSGGRGGWLSRDEIVLLADP